MTPFELPRPVDTRCSSMAFCLMVLLALIPMGGGCASNAEPTEASTFAIDVSEYHRIFDAAVGVLRDEGMTVDRQDARFGVITTKPMGAPTLFEPWRPGNRTAGQALDSTVNDQRRRVTVTLSPQSPMPSVAVEVGTGTSEVIDVLAEEAQTAVQVYLLRVDVQVQRREVPVHYLTGSMAGHTVIRRLHSTPEELVRRHVAGEYWQPLGRDVALEGRLAATIIRQSMAP